jgi:cation:H+ antiporter
MTLGWLLVGAASTFLMMAASRVALRHSLAVSQRLRVPPFFVGFTLVAVGTDMPEIVNSVVAAYLGHGDVSLGDEVGSVFTQGTLILGLFPFFTQQVPFRRRDVVLLPALTAAALVVGIALTDDGEISRLDSVTLLLAWIAATAIAWKYRGQDPPSPPPGAVRSALYHGALALLALGVVGIAAAGLVFAVVEVSATLGVPEYVVSFFGASLGTSMPELAVEITALRRGETQVALGDVLGSCLVDASLAIALGPLLFPTLVTSALALRGALLAIAAMAAVALLLGLRGRHGRLEGSLLVGVYLIAYLALLAGPA